MKKVQTIQLQDKSDLNKKVEELKRQEASELEKLNGEFKDLDNKAKKLEKKVSLTIFE